MTATYETARAEADRCTAIASEISNRLNAVAGTERDAMGMTPQHIRESAEFRALQSAYAVAHRNMQAANRFMVRNFKREHAAYHRALRAA